MLPFEYAKPATLEEAIGFLGDDWEAAAVLAGGTDLITTLKQGIEAPKRLVSLRALGDLRGISENDDAMTIGATTTLAELIAHDGAQQLFPALTTAAEQVSAAQMLSTGTVGGDCCQRPRCWYYRNGHGLLAMYNGKSLVPEGDNRYHAVFGNDGPAYFVNPSSLAPGLVALDAELEIAGPVGSRKVAVADFYQTPSAEGERENILAPNEILTAIVIPKQGLANATYEIRHRAGLDWPYATASVAFKRDGDSLSDARVVLGHVAPVPWRCEDAVAALNAAAASEEAAGAAGEAAAARAKPLSRNAYKAPMVKTAVKRAVLRAAGMEA